MDENTIIEQLEELIKGFGVQIRHEPIKQDEDSINVVVSATVKTFPKITKWFPPKIPS